MTGERRCRVLVVDDSPTVRAVLRRVLGRSQELEIVAEAADGLEALRAVSEHLPDVILMDVEMPNLDGFAATERIMANRPTPIVILTSQANRDHLHTAFEAMRHGAVELLAKPTEPSGWDALADSLPRVLASAARLAPAIADDGAAPAPPRVPAGSAGLRVVAVGASTGGPGAVRELLSAFPPSVPLGVLVVQHIAMGFENGLAEWLRASLRMDVGVARNGETLEPGAVRIGPSGVHLKLGRDLTISLDGATAPRGGHRPSVDVLLESCAEALPAQTAGVVLTGMGRDGAEGLAALRRAGGFTFVQDEASSVVFGMPRAALESGGADTALAPVAIGRSLIQLCRWDRT